MKKYFLILTILTSANLYSAPIETKALMHYFYGVLVGLKPYMLNYEEFQKPENAEKIKHELADFRKKILSHQPEKISQTPGFNYSYTLLGKHIGDTLSLYEAKVYAHAWEKLNATTSFCIGCHTRLPEKVNMEITNWSKIEGEKNPPKTISDAEFLYLSHQYPQAMEIFDSKIRAFNQSKDNKDDLLKMYERKLALYSRVQRDPKAAIDSLKIDLQNKNIPQNFKDGIKTWIEGFTALLNSKQKPFQFAKDTISKNAEGGKINLFDPATIPLLYSAGIIYERIFQSNNSKETPELLYLLSQAERVLTSIRVYSLSDIYLSECVLQFPKNPVAKKCFADYELSMKLRYGATIPEYINSSIESLRKSLAK